MLTQCAWQSSALHPFSFATAKKKHRLRDVQTLMRLPFFNLGTVISQSTQSPEASFLYLPAADSSEAQGTFLSEISEKMYPCKKYFLPQVISYGGLDKGAKNIFKNFLEKKYRPLIKTIRGRGIFL